VPTPDGEPLDVERAPPESVVLPLETVEAVNRYRFARRAELGRIPSQSAALAELIQKGLEAFEREGQAPPKGRGHR
jgi:hypothetical protein